MARRNRPTATHVRAARRTRRRNRRRWLKYVGGSVALAVAMAFIVGLFLPGLNLGGGGGGFFGGRDAPDGPGIRVDDIGASHINLGQGHPNYASVPATSGSHYSQPLAPVSWGVHDEAVEDEFFLHNLEHGGIGVFYSCPDGCDELVEQLEDIVNQSRPTLKVLLSPYPDMDTRIALVAWTFIDKLEGFDRDRIVDFIQAHESSPNAPEPNAP